MLTTAQAAPVESALETSYVAKGGVAGIIPWDTLIPILMQFLTGCLTPKAADVKSAVAGNRFDAGVRLAMIEVFGLGSYRRHNGPAVTASFREVTPTLGDDVLTAAID